MTHFLSNCGDGNILLGRDAEQISDFYAVKVDSDWEGRNSFGIGICSEGHGLEPHLLMQPERNILNGKRESICSGTRKRSLSL